VATKFCTVATNDCGSLVGDLASCLPFGAWNCDVASKIFGKCVHPIYVCEYVDFLYCCELVVV
jgi:hypothetical protein